jgi:uncharacterized protein YlxP (DUF503 family)
MEKPVYVGILDLDVLLDHAESLKAKRAVIRPVLARLRRLEVAVAEVGDPDRLRRAAIGVATVSGDTGQLDTCERQVADHPELTLLSARRRVVGEHDEPE